MAETLVSVDTAIWEFGSRTVPGVVSKPTVDIALEMDTALFNQAIALIRSRFRSVVLA